MKKLVGTMQSTPDQESREIMENIPKAGLTGIFSFPFSLKSKTGIHNFEGKNTNFRYRFEYHFDSKLKHQFFIDENGKCVENPIAVKEFVNLNFELINNKIFQTAAKKAIAGNDVAQYMIVCIDAQNSYTRGNYWESALYLSLSIDMARQTLFFNKFPNSIRKNKICFTNEDLEETDLRKVLDSILYKECQRSLKIEQPDVWSSFNNLFLTRHQLAHGKNKALINGQLTDLTSDLAEEWILTAMKVISFIENVCDAPVKFSIY